MSHCILYILFPEPAIYLIAQNKNFHNIFRMSLFGKVIVFVSLSFICLEVDLSYFVSVSTHVMHVFVLLCLQAEVSS